MQRRGDRFDKQLLLETQFLGKTRFLMVRDAVLLDRFTFFASLCYICLQDETKVYGEVPMTILIALFVVGWIAAAVLGTQAYFRGEQSKPIHDRNWRSESFEKLSESITGTNVDYSKRVPASSISDAYNSNLLPSA